MAQHCRIHPEVGLFDIGDKCPKCYPKPMSNENGPYIERLKPAPPPCRTVTSFMGGEIETKESIRRTENWREKENLKSKMREAYFEGRASRDPQFAALESENAELKKQLALEEMNRNESTEVIVALMERVKVLEDALKYMADGRNWESGRGDFFAFLLPGHSEYGYPPSYAKKALGGKP